MTLGSEYDIKIVINFISQLQNKLFDKANYSVYIHSFRSHIWAK